MADARLPAAKRRKIDFSDDFVVFVGTGTQQKTFTVTRYLLTKKTSDFMKKCCSGSWKESETKTTTLPEADSEAFGVYVQWLNLGEVVLSDESEDTELEEKDDSARRNAARSSYDALANLAILADVLLDAAFHNAVIDHYFVIREHVEIHPNSRHAKLLADKIAGPSLAKQLIVDWYAAYVDESWFHLNRERIHKDFLFDVMISLLRKSDGKTLDPSVKNRCAYHLHNEQVRKCEE